ncbi:MAG: guanylate kinase, partial [Pelagibacteraceae bacterium]|nr:guanylate kinase [Pelagibacteraceae bacterium]
MNIDQSSKIIIISSPSGAGKTTLCKLLLKKMNNVDLSISYTSRNQRLNEVNGKDYF